MKIGRSDKRGKRKRKRIESKRKVRIEGKERREEEKR